MTLRSMEGLNAEQEARLAAFWWRRAEGEITSWLGFQHVLTDLRAEGSPKAVLALAERSVEDEHRHAMFCRDWALRFGHPDSELKPRFDRAPSIPHLSERQNRLFRIGLCCFTETVGCFLLRRVRSRVTNLELRRLNRRHLADELRHSRVGWGHLSMLDAEGKAILRDLLPTLFHNLPAICRDDAGEEHDELVPYGYFTPSLLRAALDDALGDVIRPGLVHLSITEAA